LVVDKDMRKIGRVLHLDGLIPKKKLKNILKYIVLLPVMSGRKGGRDEV
jgi:hypothetical protein